MLPRPFYQIVLTFLLLLFKGMSTFIPKWKQMSRVRKQQKLDWAKRSPNKDPLLWFHAASLGEFEQARPLIESCKKNFPEYKILLTFFSPSGFEVRKNYPLADEVLYLPFDRKRNITDWLNVFNPSCVLFVKYEFWQECILQLHQKKIPLVYFSVSFRPQQYFFKPQGWYARKVLKKVTSWFVQDEQSVLLLKSIGIDANVYCIGDTRADRVYEMAKERTHFPEIEKWIDNRFTLVCGSCWKEDLNVIKILQSNTNICLIIAPHVIEEAEVIEDIKLLEGFSIQRYTSFIKSNRTEKSQVLFMDTMGMLQQLYRLGDVCYVGGAFRTGLHNILEAAAHGKPVVFGPKYHKFREAKGLIEAGAGFSIATSEDLEKLIISYQNQAEKLRLHSSIAAKYVFSQIGATHKIVLYLQSLLSIKIHE